LVLGYWPKTPIPNPQSPIPNPQINIKNKINNLNKKIKIKKNNKKLINLMQKNQLLILIIKIIKAT
jgi:hypothetical protein